jgi:hypothetical protein
MPIRGKCAQRRPESPQRPLAAERNPKKLVLELQTPKALFSPYASNLYPILLKGHWE